MKSKKQGIKYSLLVILATIFMGVGYAKVNGTNLSIAGTGDSTLPKGVLITEVNYVFNESADIENSKINHIVETMFDSQVTLGNVSSSTITYEVVVYNNTDQEQLFIEAITDKNDSSYYSNPSIGFSYTKLKEYTTTLAPKETITFEITFKYEDGADISNNTLMSKINFRFKEVPTLVLSNANKTYTIDDMYPGYTKEYEFTVSNYNDSKINIVPMTYSFEPTVDSPFLIKIYDEEGNEVVGDISIAGDGESKIKHTYTLKIIWDDSVSDVGIDYSEYENKEFIGNVVFKAVPNDQEKYLEYSIAKKFDMNITATPFNFNIEADASIKMEKEAATLGVAINNYNTDQEYNLFDTDYEISIDGNDKFTFSVEDKTPIENVVARTLSGGEVLKDSFDIKFIADINDLDSTEEIILKIVIKSPYVKEILLPITINLQAVTVTLNANGGSVSPSSMVVYKGRTYTSLPTPTWLGHTFNGWYTTAESGGTKITTSTEVTTTSSTQTLYARWTSYLLADTVSVGNYVNYPVYYDNVGTNADGDYVPEDDYTSWRVLSIDGSGNNKYVRLVTAGIPLTYVHPKATNSGSTSVTALTTNFFSTTINSTSTNYKYRKSGFKAKSSSTTYITTMGDGGVKDLFENVYTQTTSSGSPMVQSMTKSDIDGVMAILKGKTTYETENGEYLTSSDLLAIPSTKSGYYAAYYLADAILYNSYYYLWNVRYAGGIIYTSSEHGVRPVVTLKTNVIKTGGSGTVSSPYTISIE